MKLIACLHSESQVCLCLAVWMVSALAAMAAMAVRVSGCMVGRNSLVKINPWCFLFNR